MKRWTPMLLAMLLGVLCVGCATTDDDGNSDIPWNAPQPWEGSPMIPGMNPGGY